MSENIKKIVKEVIAKEYREEAMDILSKSSQKDVDKFIRYYKKGNYIACCMQLDSLKTKLVEDKLMSNDGAFGIIKF
jgi:hypothetical protein